MDLAPEDVERERARLFAACPLARISEWIAAGKAPTAEILRAAGLRADAEIPTAPIVRDIFLQGWGYSIPCAEAIGALHRASPLVDLGAGSGYWTALMRAAGADIEAIDTVTSGAPPGYSRINAGTHCEVTQMDALEAIQRWPDRNLFCSWPSETDDWCAQAAAALARGRYLVLIGDDRGGHTGTDSLFDILERDFEPAGALAIPQFPGINDRLTAWWKRHAA